MRCRVFPLNRKQAMLDASEKLKAALSGPEVHESWERTYQSDKNVCFRELARISLDRLEFARDKAAALGAQVNICGQNVTSFGFRDNSFDGVLAGAF